MQWSKWLQQANYTDCPCYLEVDTGNPAMQVIRDTTLNYYGDVGHLSSAIDYGRSLCGSKNSYQPEKETSAW